MNIHERNRATVARFRTALYDCEPTRLARQLVDIFAPDCQIHLSSPLDDLTGPDALYETVYRPLLTAIPDLERRDFLVMAGASAGANWVGCAGHYIGLFTAHWLDIPPTRHAAAMRYHEFFRLEDDQIVEMQAVWDIPQLMLQANAWPMTPPLAVNWLAPGPATQDGFVSAPGDGEKTTASLRLVREMLTDMGRHPLSGDSEVMRLERYWHPQMMWYGPAGIGTMRGIDGFRRWHQIPFLKAMPDRRGAMSEKAIFFAEGAYVGTTGWPNMQMTISGDGWLGIPPVDKSVTMRSLDFWRCENGLIRENWVLVDLLHIYDQIGINVFERMRETTYARQPFH